MRSLFDTYKREIEQYCNDNGLDFSKMKGMGRCWGKDHLFIQYVDPSEGKMGLLDETPAPVVLIMKIVNGKPEFEQTQYTQVYLNRN